MKTSPANSHPETGPFPDWGTVRAHPAWATYVECLDRLPADRFPTLAELDALLPAGLATARGHPVRFEDPGRLPAGPEAPGYEAEIGASGRISTRAANRHDLCNALVWATFPRTKTALNARHLAAPPAAQPGRRGPVRDALTLFDECGGVFHCPRRAPLEAVARHDWRALFGTDGDAWPSDLGLTLIGHGTLEQLWNPYKAITARCLLLHAPEGMGDRRGLDAALASFWSDASLVSAPRDLCPFPIMGVPGWWPGVQQRDFYGDSGVFRPPPAGRASPPVFAWPS